MHKIFTASWCTHTDDQVRPPQYLQIVKGYHDGHRAVKPRFIANLGRIDQLETDDLNALINGLQRVVGRPERLPDAL